MDIKVIRRLIDNISRYKVEYTNIISTTDPETGKHPVLIVIGIKYGDEISLEFGDMVTQEFSKKVIEDIKTGNMHYKIFGNLNRIAYKVSEVNSEIIGPDAYYDKDSQEEAIQDFLDLIEIHLNYFNN